MQCESYISIGAVAEQLKVSKSTVSKRAQELGIKYEYLKEDSTGKIFAYLTQGDAEKLMPQEPKDRRSMTSALIQIAHHYGMKLDTLSEMICDYADFLNGEEKK